MSSQMRTSQPGCGKQSLSRKGNKGAEASFIPQLRAVPEAELFVQYLLSELFQVWVICPPRHTNHNNFINLLKSILTSNGFNDQIDYRRIQAGNNDANVIRHVQFF